MNLFLFIYFIFNCWCIILEIFLVAKATQAFTAISNSVSKSVGHLALILHTIYTYITPVGLFSALFVWQLP